MTGIQLDPWKILKEVHWRPAREAIYLVSSAAFSQFRENSTEPPEVGIPLGTPPAPADFNNLYTISIRAECLAITAQFYNDCALFDENGGFFGHATQSEFEVAKPSNPVIKEFSSFQAHLFLQETRFAAHAEGSAPPLFPGYVLGPASLISKGNLYTGASSLFDTGIVGDGLGTMCHQFLSDQQIASFDVTPSQATFRGRSYTPIAARYGDTTQSIPGFTFNANSVSVLFQRT